MASRTGQRGEGGGPALALGGGKVGREERRGGEGRREGKVWREKGRWGGRREGRREGGEGEGKGMGGGEKVGERRRRERGTDHLCTRQIEVVGQFWEVPEW